MLNLNIELSSEKEQAFLNIAKYKQRRNYSSFNYGIFRRLRRCKNRRTCL